MDSFFMPSAILLISLLKGLGYVGCSVSIFQCFLYCISNGKILKRIRTWQSCAKLTREDVATYSLVTLIPALVFTGPSHEPIQITNQITNVAENWHLPIPTSGLAFATWVAWGLALRNICSTPELNGSNKRCNKRWVWQMRDGRT